jgi:hypothetical protein
MGAAIALLLSGALSSEPGAQQIARAAAQADLDTLRAVVHRYSAYRLVNGYPFDRHIDSLNARLPDSVSLGELWHSVQTLVGRHPPWLRFDPTGSSTTESGSRRTSWYRAHSMASRTGGILRWQKPYASYSSESRRVGNLQ